MDDEIAQFAAFTGATPAAAQQYLTLTDGNLEQAIQLYFDDPSLGNTSAQSNAPATSRPSQGTGPGEDAIPISDDEMDQDVQETSRRTATNTFADEDAEMARRLQESEYQTNGPSAAEDIRAPMARTTETLVGGDYDDDEDEDDAATRFIRQQIMQRQQQRSTGSEFCRHSLPFNTHLLTFSGTGIFNQRNMPSNIWDEDQAPDLRARNLAAATGGASTHSSKSNLLAEMFRPPFEIMSRLPWEQARDEGREQEKWLIVNVQDSAVFDCQALNRDIWKNKEIKECIKEHFIFLQYMKDDPRGQNYFSYYFQGLMDNQAAYPHIAIVDPRTGEQVKVWSGPPAPVASDFIMQLYEFLDRYSLKAGSRNPVAKRKSEAKNFEAMTEDEQLQAAINASLGAGGSAIDVDDPDDMTKSINLGKGKERAEDLIDLSDSPAARSETVQPESQQLEETIFSHIPDNRPHEEPVADPATTTRIQFRWDGGRIVRRFALTDPVQRIYEWLKSDPRENKGGLDFDLIFVNKNLIDSLDQTIEQAGLKNGSVMVEFQSQD